MSAEVLVMSQKARDSLSAKDRKLFREAMVHSSQFMHDFDRKPFGAAMAGIDARAQRDPATAQLIERIRKVE
jgi:hypothetical protein